MAYHVTLASNIPSIMRDGIIPAIGENSLACRESEARVYAFINREELVSALLNWLGELFEDTDESLAYVEISDDCFETIIDSNGDVFFECHSSEIIPVKKIKSISYE